MTKANATLSTTAASPAIPSIPDSPIMRLFRAWIAASKYADERGNSDDENNRRVDLVTPIEREIRQAKASSVLDLAAQSYVGIVSLDPGVDFLARPQYCGIAGEWSVQLLNSLLHHHPALAAAVATPAATGSDIKTMYFDFGEFSIFDAWRVAGPILQEAIDAHCRTSADDTRLNHLVAAFDHFEKLMLETPTTTSADVLLKVENFLADNSEWTEGPRIRAAILDDLRRLAER